MNDESEHIEDQIQNLGSFIDNKTVDNYTLGIEVKVNSTRPLSEKLTSISLFEPSEGNQMDVNE